MSQRCTFCDQVDLVEWRLDIVWRHDRTKTMGSRVVEADREIENPEYACNPCIALLRRGILTKGQTRMSL